MWVDIEGYEGKYCLSDKGEIMSLNYNNTGKPGLLKLKTNKLGFLEVKLSKNNKAKDYMVANLVGQYFVDGYKKGAVIYNIDGNRANCNKDNLKWILPTEQRHLMYNNGKRKIGKPSGNKISFHREGYKSFKELAEAYLIEPEKFGVRLNRGWSLEEALMIKSDKKNRGRKPDMFEYYGEILTSTEICKRNNINKKIFSSRIEKGWNVYEAAEIEVGGRKNG